MWDIDCFSSTFQNIELDNLNKTLMRIADSLEAISERLEYLTEGKENDIRRTY